jgi:hypothetical protein
MTLLRVSNFSEGTPLYIWIKVEAWNSENPSLVILSTIAVLDDEEKMLLMVDQV